MDILLRMIAGAAVVTMMLAIFTFFVTHPIAFIGTFYVLIFLVLSFVVGDMVLDIIGRILQWMKK